MKQARWALFDSATWRAAWLLTLLISAASAANWAYSAEPVQRIRAADFVLGDSDQPPPASEPWQPQSLPDRWSLTRPGVYGSAWYRVRFELSAAAAQDCALLLPVDLDLRAVRLNGGGLAGIGGEQALGPEDSRPRLLSLPPSLLRAGGNELLLQVRIKQHDDAGMPTISIGGAKQLRDEFRRRYLFQVTGAKFATLLTGLIGIFVLLFWVRRRQESTYGLFGLALMLRAALGADMFFDVSPLPAPYWMLIVAILWDIFQLLINLFVLRFAGWRWPRYEVFLWGYAFLFGALGYAHLVHGYELPAALYWLNDDYLPVASFTGIALLAAWRMRTHGSILLALTTLFVMFSYIYETMVPEALDLGPLWPYRFLPLYLVIGWVLIDRFASSLNEAESLNADLEQRVRDKHAELEQNYRRLGAMERQQAVVEERQRIMSDMHDGVGGQLISAIALVERGETSAAQVAAALRECLDNLRLIIDSLEPNENDLLPVLGNLRYRIDGRLKDQGITLDWQVRELPRLACLTPQNVLHVLRILQEAFTNVLKHARASRIRVETGSEPDGKHVFIRVQDNGTGFASPGPGRGLRNMRQRAQTIGGDLEIESTSVGTTLNLLLPVA
jgi:signal transduction histidine kinase